MAYAAAGLAPPKEIRWVNGPLDLARDWTHAGDAPGKNVLAVVINGPCRRAEAAIDRAVGLAVRVNLASEPRLTRVPSFCATMDEATLRDCERVRPHVHVRIRRLFRRRSEGPGTFSASSFSFHSAPTLGALEYFHDVCALRKQTEALRGLWQVARNASWMVPHSHVCWLAERPQELHVDMNGRLHCANGPAVRYPDGWSAYAWKGVLVPKWIIERRELVGVRTIANAQDPQIRRCMIDIMTPERFIAEGGAYRIAQDETGILWRQRWRWEAWAAVEVVNGTPEPDGTRKRYFLQVPPTMRSPREAVAWTYGLPELRYRPVVRT